MKDTQNEGEIDARMRHITPMGECVWELARTYKEAMKTTGRLFMDKGLLEDILTGESREWSTIEQLANVACLPGIVGPSIAMADAHPGYGFPIGGVGAFDAEEGVITMGGVGFDSNCGVRSLTTSLKEQDTRTRLRELVDSLYQDVPAGLGARSLEVSPGQEEEIMVRGAEWAVENGYGWEEDLEHTEDSGRLDGADPGCVGERAKRRGMDQFGTLGSGNHYLEIQVAEAIKDPVFAKAMGVEEGGVVVSIHCGSRAIGHQVGADYLKVLDRAVKKYRIPIPDRELVCAPFYSQEGQAYFGALNCAMNVAYANRQIIAHRVRECFSKILGKSPEDLGMRQVWDVGHNTGKLEEHRVDGEKRKLVLHRKGATRAFGPGREELPQRYRDLGQPVLVGGSMGTHSFILRPTPRAMELSWGSSIHGAGRAMSRSKAKRRYWGQALVKELGKRGIIVRGHSMPGIAEEAPEAYKDVTRTVRVMELAGLATVAVRLRPIGNIKG